MNHNDTISVLITSLLITVIETGAELLRGDGLITIAVINLSVIKLNLGRAHRPLSE